MAPPPPVVEANDCCNRLRMVDQLPPAVKPAVAAQIRGFEFDTFTQRVKVSTSDSRNGGQGERAQEQGGGLG